MKTIKEIFKSFVIGICCIFISASDNLTSEQIKHLLLAPEMQAIRSRGVLRVAMHKNDHPPFFMVNEKGQLIGLDVSLAKDIAHHLSVDLEINRDSESFDDVVYRVARGEADVGISKLSLTLKRAQLVRYTKPYFTMKKAVLLNRVQLTKFGETLSLNQLFGSKRAIIGALTGSSYQEFAHQTFPHATVYDNLSWNGNIIPKLINGEILGAYRDELEVRRVMLAIENAALFLLAIMLEDSVDSIMMVTNEKAPMLQLWLDLYIQSSHHQRNIVALIEEYKEYVYKGFTK